MSRMDLNSASSGGATIADNIYVRDTDGAFGFYFGDLGPGDKIAFDVGESEGKRSDGRKGRYIYFEKWPFVEDPDTKASGDWEGMFEIRRKARTDRERVFTVKSLGQSDLPIRFCFAEDMLAPDTTPDWGYSLAYSEARTKLQRLAFIFWRHIANREERWKSLLKVHYPVSDGVKSVEVRAVKPTGFKMHQVTGLDVNGWAKTWVEVNKIWEPPVSPSNEWKMELDLKTFSIKDEYHVDGKEWLVLWLSLKEYSFQGGGSEDVAIYIDSIGGGPPGSPKG